MYIPEPKDLPMPYHVRRIPRPAKERRRINYYENLVENQKNFYADLIEKQQEEIAALKNRCKVAEDLNKVYVRMYLEMQEKYDRCVCESYWATFEDDL